MTGCLQLPLFEGKLVVCRYVYECRVDVYPSLSRHVDAKKYCVYSPFHCSKLHAGLSRLAQWSTSPAKRLGPGSSVCFHVEFSARANLHVCGKEYRAHKNGKWTTEGRKINLCSHGDNVLASSECHLFFFHDDYLQLGFLFLSGLNKALNFVLIFFFWIFPAMLTKGGFKGIPFQPSRLTIFSDSPKVGPVVPYSKWWQVANWNCLLSIV